MIKKSIATPGLLNCVVISSQDVLRTAYKYNRRSNVTAEAPSAPPLSTRSLLH